VTLHVHALAGCAPEPLSHYLKALGVLRLVGEQADPAARARWSDDAFALVTSLDARELLRFFLDAYAPTPLLAPWNGGSGFYPNDTKDGIDALAASTAARFGDYREAIARARAIVGDRRESPKKEEKLALLQACRRAWEGRNLEWLDAAVVLTGEDTAQYPALLGTGGNDGRLDFTNNQMQRIVELFDAQTGAPQAGTAELLAAALFGGPVPGLKKRAIGQFLPGGAGGVNQAAGFLGDSLVNPWDFVLMLEGAILLQVAAVRRLDGGGLPQAAAPFSVRAQAGGYASATAADESARGEQWMPLWRGPASLREVRALFAEGRLQIGAARAHKALDAARAVARLGAARGVSAFVRFGYVERNGQANLAVPLGRWPVRERPELHLLDEIDPWVDRLRRASRGSAAPAAFGRALRRIEGAMLAVCRSASSERWQAVLIALGEAEDLLVARPKATKEAGQQPLPALSYGWFEAANDRSAEVRLALAIASQIGPATLGSIRAHCLPLDPKARAPRFATGADGLLRDPRVVWSGVDLTSDLCRVAVRRIVEAEQRGEHAFPLRGRAFAAASDIAAFLAARVDEARIARLARAFMAIGEWPEPREEPPPRDDLDAPDVPSALHAVFRLAYAPEPVGELIPRCDPAPIRLLSSGRLDEAARAAIRRLSASGVRPKVRHLAGSPDLARRLAAAIAIPVSRADLARLLRLVCKPSAALQRRADSQE